MCSDLRPEPVEVTPEMIEAGEVYISEAWTSPPRNAVLWTDFVEGLFKAMAAASSRPQGKTVDRRSGP